MATCMACNIVDPKFKPWNIKFIGLSVILIFCGLCVFRRMEDDLLWREYILEVK